MKIFHSIASTVIILVNDFKSSMRHTRHERLHDVIRNVSSRGEQSSAKSTHGLQLRSKYINVNAIHLSLEVLDRVQPVNTVDDL